MRTCSSCGKEFETLSSYRIHRSECPAADVQKDVSDMSIGELSELAVRELLICDVCESQNDGTESIRTAVRESGVVIEVEYECRECGAHNDNEAILS